MNDGTAATQLATLLTPTAAPLLTPAVTTSVVSSGLSTDPEVTCAPAFMDQNGDSQMIVDLGSASVSSDTYCPGIRLVDTALVTPAGDQSGVRVGDVVAFDYLLNNSGQATVNGLAINDTAVGAVPCPMSSLAPGMSESCVQSRTVTQADVDAGSVVSSATAQGITASGAVVSATWRVTVSAVPAAGSLALSTVLTPSSVSAGVTLNRSFSATNTGNVTLAGLAISDAPTAPAGQASAVSCPTTTLAPGTSVTCTSSYVTSQADAGNGRIVDVATASATGANGAQITSAPSSGLATVSAPTVTRTAVTAGSLPVGSEAYSIPSGALYVSATGSDSGPGTLAAPFRTLQHAISVAASGATIVLRAGEYNEADIVPAGKGLTIENYPHEAAYLDGATHVNSGWVQTGSTWTMPNWTVQFDNSVSDSPTPPVDGSYVFEGPQNPLANHVDQIWIDGVRQQLVASSAAVGLGQFYADYANHDLVLGTNPAGHDVKASNKVTGLYVYGASSTIRGIGIRDYADSLDQYGAIVISGASGVTVSDLVVSENATFGLYYSRSPNGVIDHITADANGMLGMASYQSDNLTVTGVQADANNTHNFNQAPESGGYKICASRNITITDSQFDTNTGPGLWFDMSDYNAIVTNSDLDTNTGHGLSFEISSKLMFVNNRVLGNGGVGLKLNDANGISLYNNTVSGSGSYDVWAVQDSRVASNLSVFGHDLRQQQPDPTVTWIEGSILAENNVFGDTKSNVVFDVQDNALNRTAAQMGLTLDSNVYARPNVNSPSWLVAWPTGATNPAVYTSVAAFRSATGEEQHAIGVDSESINPDGSLIAAVAAASSTAAQLPPQQVLSLISGEVPLANQPHLGAWT
jgi:parallel beta-helix repeat protein